MDARIEEIKKLIVNLHYAVDVDSETKRYIFDELKIEWLVEQVEELQKDNTRLRKQLSHNVEPDRLEVSG